MYVYLFLSALYGNNTVVTCILTLSPNPKLVEVCWGGVLLVKKPHLHDACTGARARLY
jgi:hypothetical protein